MIDNVYCMKVDCNEMKQTIFGHFSKPLGITYKREMQINTSQNSALMQQSVEIQMMLKDHSEYQIRKETIKWYHLNQQYGYNSHNLKVVHQTLCLATQANVTYDARFADAIFFCINFILCTAFKDEEQNAVDLEIFVKMAEQLKQEGLIGKRHLYDIMRFRPYNITTKINEFMVSMGVGRFSGEELEQYWEQMLGMSLFQFWNAVMRKKVSQVILVTLYDFMNSAPSINTSTQIREYVWNLRRQQKEQEENYLMKYKRQFKQKKYDLLNSSQDKNELQDLLNPDKVKYNPIQTVDDRLKYIAYFYSMFHNQAHQNNLENINRLITFVQNNIFLNQEFRLELFGSLRSTFALSNQYDIDFNYLSLRQKHINRQTAIFFLKRIQNQFRNKAISWVRKPYVDQREVLAVPYLKFDIDPIQFRRCFGIENTTKLDFTVGNRTAVINSVLLAHYSQIQEIHFLCILVKIWAKSRFVINRTFPFNGLSSYVMVLMCLYYLMETDQIDFIEISEQELKNIDVGTFTPNIKRLKMKSLFQNFKGFLEFYGETGQFQRQRKVVCLLKDKLPAQFKWNQDLIINVYDFIDKTNPGRLTMQFREFIFVQFRRALQLLKCNTIAKINQIFQSN